MTNYPLLAAIMEEASAYYRWKAGRLRLMTVVLNLSYRAEPSQPVATFASHAPLLKLTRYRHPSELSRAIDDLVCCRVLLREGRGRGGVALTPMPDWWNWQVQAVDEVCADKRYVLGLVGWMVRGTVGAWEAEPATIDTTLAFARRYTVDQNLELIGADKTLSAEVAAVAREQAAATLTDGESESSDLRSQRQVGRPKNPHGKSRRPGHEAPIDADVDDAVAYAARLWPEWEGGGLRRDGYFETLATKEGARRVYRVLMAADDEIKRGNTIVAPCRWVGSVLASFQGAAK